MSETHIKYVKSVCLQALFCVSNQAGIQAEIGSPLLRKLGTL